MAGLAQLLKQKGHEVSGSDQADSALLNNLRQAGIKIFIGHQSNQVGQADRVILSSAIAKNNPEWQFAMTHSIPILHRAEGLAELIQQEASENKDHCTVLVLGSHGKTTTTGLMISILSAAGLDPSYAIGATYYGSGLNAKLGGGRCFVLEGDESDRSFQYFQPDILILTNIDEDHLEAYEHNLQNLKQAYLDFILKLKPGSVLIFNQDDPHILSLREAVLAQRQNLKIKTYGYGLNANMQLSGVQVKADKTLFNLNQNLFSVSLLGQHNAENSAAAVLAARELGVNLNSQQRGLENYRGASRRCEIYGEKDFLKNSQKFLLIEDYGHHPVEIKVTLKALKQAYPDKRLVLVFQPHRYTRTQALMDDFAEVLSLADVLILLEIYPASESPIEGVSSAVLFKKIGQIKSFQIYLSTLSNVLKDLSAIVKTGDLVLMQGAGSIHEVAQNLVEGASKVLETCEMKEIDSLCH